MSTLTNFFVAPVADVQSHKLNEGVPAAFPSALCDYLDEMKVALLENLLTGRDPLECLKILTGRSVYAHGASGIEVFRLSDEMVKALAAQSAASPVEPAKRWLANGEWGRFGRRAGDLRDLVDALAAICKLASAAASSPDHGLFLWVCP